MFGSIGVPELVIVLIVLALWLVPFVAGVWALVTLQRLTVGQQQIKAQLEAIERSLKGRPTLG